MTRPTDTTLRALLAPLLALAASGCLPADRGLETTHQPIVGPNGAYVAGCPDWRDAYSTPSEGQSSNFGCATSSNLAAMIADPQDLVHGQESRGPDAETAAKAIKAWRDMAPTGKAGIEKVNSKGS